MMASLISASCMLCRPRRIGRVAWHQRPQQRRHRIDVVAAGGAQKSLKVILENRPSHEFLFRANDAGMFGGQGILSDEKLFEELLAGPKTGEGDGDVTGGARRIANRVS